MRIFMIVLYLLLVIVGVSFASLNAAIVKVNLYFSILSMPISVLVVLMLGVGVLMGCFLSLSRFWRLKRENRKIRNQLQMTEKEIKNLRAIPLQDQH